VCMSAHISGALLPLSLCLSLSPSLSLAGSLFSLPVSLSLPLPVSPFLPKSMNATEGARVPKEVDARQDMGVCNRSTCMQEVYVIPLFDQKALYDVRLSVSLSPSFSRFVDRKRVCVCVRVCAHARTRARAHLCVCVCACV